MREPRIAIVHDGLATAGGGGGAERVLETLRTMLPDAPIFTTVYSKSRMPDMMREWDIRPTFLQQFPGGPDAYMRYFPLFPCAAESLDLRGFDVVISCSHAVAKGVITAPGSHHVCMCYSPLRYVWDMYQEYREVETLSNFQRAMLPFLMHYMRAWDTFSSAGVDEFVAISHYVKRRIEKYYRRRARVIYPPVRMLKSVGQPSDYYLVVSRLVAYKRVDLVVEAFNRLGWPLVVIGDGKERQALEHKAGPNIQFLGRRSDEEVRTYFSGARGFVFPGIEDFGIAPVEAMSAGVPVVAFGRGGAKETVLEGKTGVLFDKQSVESLLEALERHSASVFDRKWISRYSERFAEERFKREWSVFLAERLVSMGFNSERLQESM
ncbi:MAG: glycosyltransferase [Candidatus Sericytochromatia bacterium]|nr:glycosyltransferase [Candidatus Sericytochromatia bacterium]